MFVIEPFDKQRHERTQFDCGTPALNDWLRTKVSQYDKRDLARTYVLVEEGHNVVQGYYSLSNHTVVFDALPELQSKGLTKIDIPVVLIGRLAVDITAQGKGHGEFLLLDALQRCAYLATKIGIQAVEVDAINNDSKRFYEKYGFISLADDEHHLFLPMKVIRQLNLPQI